MKRLMIQIWIYSQIILVLPGCNSPKQSKIDSLEQQIAEMKEMTEPLPASLDNFYPPKSSQPVYLFKMISLSNSVTATMVDLMENDIDNAQVNFKKFRSEYIDIAQMVPEWAGRYPMGPLTEFENALNSGDPDRVMKAFDGVGHVCHTCHMDKMTQVYFKYHWGDFKEFQIPDPVGEGDIGIDKLMHYLSGGLVGIVNDLEQGQIEAARHQFQFFSTSFQALKETCILCHETERFYYTDRGVQNMVDNLGQALSEEVINMEKIVELTQAIGIESCYKCHLVHIPAALAMDSRRLEKHVGEN